MLLIATEGRGDACYDHDPMFEPQPGDSIPSGLALCVYVLRKATRHHSFYFSVGNLPYPDSATLASPNFNHHFKKTPNRLDVSSLLKQKGKESQGEREEERKRKILSHSRS